LGQQVLGAIVVQSEKTPNMYSGRQRDLLTAMAGQVSIAIQNARLYQNIQISETRFRDVALASADWVWETDLQGRYTYCSDKVLDVLGYRPDEMYGKSPADFMPGYEAERVVPIMAEAISKAERMIDLENRNLTRDGREIILFTNGLPILDETDTMVGYRGVSKDVTTQRVDEAIDEVLAEITRAGVSTENISDALAMIHQSILHIVPAKNIYFAMYDRERNIISYPFKMDEQDLQPWEAHEPSNNLTHYIVRTGNPLFATAEDIDKLSETGEIKLEGSPARQWIGIPLKTKETMGMFATQTYDDSLVLTENHFDILKRLAPQIATVVEKIRAEESLSKSEAELRALFNSMNDVIVVYDNEGR
ncbi:MAG: PAS domain S-box protein, partial [Anaerolineales bacterium]|nr:PAS domain S-box protein [Anaerolineales bacterium]